MRSSFSTIGQASAISNAESSIRHTSTLAYRTLKGLRYPPASLEAIAGKMILGETPADHSASISMINGKNLKQTKERFPPNAQKTRERICSGKTGNMLSKDMFTNLPLTFVSSELRPIGTPKILPKRWRKNCALLSRHHH